jgi:hypothetical protein
MLEEELLTLRQEHQLAAARVLWQRSRLLAHQLRQVRVPFAAPKAATGNATNFHSLPSCSYKAVQEATARHKSLAAEACLRCHALLNLRFKGSALGEVRHEWFGSCDVHSLRRPLMTRRGSHSIVSVGGGVRHVRSRLCSGRQSGKAPPGDDGAQESGVCAPSGGGGCTSDVK